MKTKYVALYRVSTGKQKKSGLGLKDQREAVLNYINQNGVLLREFTETESGRNRDRIKFNQQLNLESLLRKRQTLLEAITYAKDNNAVLVVKEHSRLTRFKLLGEYLMASGVQFICSDSPNDTPLIISIKIALGEDEAIKISQRTSASLKQRIKTKGKWQTINPDYTSGKIGKLGTKTIKDNAKNNANNQRAAAMICAKIKEGLNYSGVASFLNENGFLTSRNKQFQPVQVQRIYDRFC